MLATSVLYLPIGRKTFDLAAAEEARAESSAWLNQNCEQVTEPADIITSVEELVDFLQSCSSAAFDTVVYQSITFADAEFALKALEFVQAPFVVWSVREPSTGGRLRLNSLTGGNSTCHTLKHMHHPFSFVFGNATEAKLQSDLQQKLLVNRVIRKLKELTIGVVGEHPPGFFFSDTDAEQLKQTLGVTINDMDLHKAFRECTDIEESRWIKAVERAEQQVVGLNRSEESVKKFAQFYTYIQDYIRANDIQAIAVRCWPEFFTELGAAACSTLSQFTEDGVMSSCESDIHGSISMFILHELSKGSAPYLGDLVHINEVSNTAVFWHCGAGAYSLANPSTGARAGVHPNRKLGFAMDFGLKSGDVTIFRLSYNQDGYRLLIMKGAALDTPQAFQGTSVEIQLSTPVRETLDQLMLEGFEPHYAIVYDDVVEPLKELGRLLGIEALIYV